MKRLVLVLTFFVMTGIVKGQDAIVVSGGEKKKVNITNYSLAMLKTDRGDYVMAEIDTVILHAKENRYSSLYKTLEKAEVQYKFDSHQVENYGGRFILEGDAVRWENIYDRDGEVLSTVTTGLKTSYSIKVIDEGQERITADLKDYAFNKNGYMCSGRVFIDIKPDKYRVRLMEISYKPGASANTMATAFLGGNPDFLFHANSDFVKRGELRKNMEVMDMMNVGLSELFDFNKISDVADDW